MKQPTRSLSMFLVCVMSLLCLLTACGGGGGSGNSSNSDPDFSYVRSLGCSASAQKEDNLEILANSLVSYVELYVQNPENEDSLNTLLNSAFADAEAKLQEKGLNYMLFSMEMKANDQKYLLYFDSNDVGNTLTTYNDGVLSSYISDAKYYGAAQKNITDNGTTVHLAVAFFAR